MTKIDIYRSFEQWKNGNVMEHGVPRTEYYSEVQLDLVEMGWKYGYDAGLAEQPAQQEHVTDGSPCWCNPELDYKDPDTGAEVWIHKEPQ